MKKNLWGHVADTRPLRAFFWSPSAVMGNPMADLPVADPTSGVLSFQRLQPGGKFVCYTAELDAGLVIGDCTLTATRAGTVLGDIQGLHGVTKPEEHWLPKRRRFRLPRKLGGTTLLLAATSGANYFHWLFESLPRLHLLKLAGIAIDTIDRFLLNENAPAFQRDTLQELGIQASRHFNCSRQRTYQCEKLLVVSPTAPPGVGPAWVCNFLRSSFLTEPANSPSRKIYVSRRTARGRRLLCEDSVLPWLRERGYEIVQTETMTFRQQVELFRSARVLVCAHGAALANMVFMPPSTQVLEFLPPEYQQFCYRELAATLNLNHGIVFGRPTSRPPADSTTTDVDIDASDFKKRVSDFENRAQ